MSNNINIRLIATEVGEYFKGDTSLNQIDRYGRALFGFEPDSFPNAAISSQRSKRIYDWILTLARQEMPSDKRISLIQTFCYKLAGGNPERCQALDKILLSGSLELPQQSRSQDSEYKRGAHEQQSAREHATVRHKLNALLEEFDSLAISEDTQRRGYALQELLVKTLHAYNLPVIKSFTRNEGGEQIDGGFTLGGWHYLVECRWRKKPADIRDLDGLRGQLERSGKQTLGIFLSIHGWSTNVVPLLKQNPEKSIILVEGTDLRTSLAGAISLPDLILGKAAKLNFESEPYYSVMDLLRAQGDS